MCGFLGLVDVGYRSELLESIRHRGPDSSGLTSFDVAGHHVHLGHRRLSIVDLSETGAQPMTAFDGTGCLIFNGEIYNHAELRAKVPDYPFRGHSDTETILALLQRYGIDCLGMLNGIFALAYLDIRGNALYTARDPFGVKPVYWTATQRSFALSSEIRGLPGDREVADGNLGTLLRMRYLPSPQTMWKDVWKVPPGHYIRVDLGRPELSWRVDHYPEWKSPVQIFGKQPKQDQFEQTLERAVSRQLMSDVDVGLFLSGGYDSTLTAYYAQKHYPGKLRSYTVGYDRRDGEDETDAAEGIAKAFGLVHQTVRMSEDTFCGSFAELMDVVEEPVASSSMIPLHALARAAAKDVKVVLSGQGADEVSGGYSRYRACRMIEYLQCARMSGVAALAARLFGNWGGDPRIGATLGGRTTLARYTNLTELFSAQDVYRMTGATADPFVLPPYAVGAIDSPDLANVVMGLDALTALPDELLMYTDKVTMHHSLECRVPFLDLELASLLASFHGSDKVGVLSGKKLQTRAARRLFPNVKLTPGKKGFQVPSRFWRDRKSQVRELLASSDSRATAFMDMKEIRRIVHEYDRGLRPDKQMFILAALAFWFENSHKRQLSPSTAV